MTAKDNLIRGLKGLKRGLTAQELAKKTGVPVKTARNVLVRNKRYFGLWHEAYGIFSIGNNWRKCRVTGKLAQVWRLA